MNDFSRAALYGATHKLIPLYKKKSGKTGIFDVVGPVCESTDTFLKNYFVEGVEAGDFLAFLDVGAYGAVLSSEYNTRPLVPEIMVYNKRYELVRSRPITASRGCCSSCFRRWPSPTRASTRLTRLPSPRSPPSMRCQRVNM